MATSTIADQLSLLAATRPRPINGDGDAFRLHHDHPLHTRAALAAELGRVLTQRRFRLLGPPTAAQPLGQVADRRWLPAVPL